MKPYKNIDLHKIILFYVGIGILAWGWIYFGEVECKIFGFRGIFEAFILGFMLFGLFLYLGMKFQWARDLEETFAAILVPLPLSAILSLSTISSLSEELLFRGAIQTQWGFVIASLLFGLAHFPLNKKMIPWTLTATAMGFILGGLYLYSGSLLSPIILHLLINFLNIWMMNQKYASVTP